MIRELAPEGYPLLPPVLQTEQDTAEVPPIGAAIGVALQGLATLPPRDQAIQRSHSQYPLTNEKENRKNTGLARMKGFSYYEAEVLNNHCWAQQRGFRMARMIRLFSKRHEKAIFDKTIGLSLFQRLRKRIWAVIDKYNYSYVHQPDPYDNWNETTDVLEQVHLELRRRYGVDALQAWNDAGEDVQVDNLQSFILGAYPSQVLDVVELFYPNLQDNQKLEFQCELNLVFEEEGSPWRFTDGQFFKADSGFLESQVMGPCYNLMKAEGYEGALEEFAEARQDFSAGDFKGAIHNSCKSMESALKTVLSCDKGNARELVSQLRSIGFYDDVPEEIQKGFGDSVLMALPYIRNRLGGHGQGDDVVEVPGLYAALALHLAAAFNRFLIGKALLLSPQEGMVSDAADAETCDGDVPF